MTDAPQWKEVHKTRHPWNVEDVVLFERIIDGKRETSGYISSSLLAQLQSEWLTKNEAKVQKEEREKERRIIRQRIVEILALNPFTDLDSVYEDFESLAEDLLRNAKENSAREDSND